MEDQQFIVSHQLYEQLLEMYDADYLDGLIEFTDTYHKYYWDEEEARQRIADTFNNKEQHGISY